jgi:hypothetical protein
LEEARHCRYEIPDSVKEILEKSIKMSKELKKIMNEKAEITKI